MKNLRVVSSVVALVFLISSYLVFNKVEISETSSQSNGAFSPNKFEAPGWGQKNSPWAREEVFLSSNTYLAQGGGYEIKSENYKVLKANSKPYKILMFGDSYTWGHGADNPQSNISLRVQEELNRLTAPNAFLVIPWTANGRNTYNYVDEFTEKRVKDINPDLVIYNYVYNDAIPNFEESMICITKSSCLNKFLPKENPIYLKCLRGEASFLNFLIGKVGGLAGGRGKDNLLVRYCETTLKRLSKKSIDEEYITYHPLANPYYDVWKSAVKRLRESFKNYPMYVVDLRNPMVSQADTDEIRSVFEANDFKYFESPWLSGKMSNFFMSGGGMEEMSVNPGDAHYSFYYNQNIAKELAKYLLGEIGEKKVSELVERAGESSAVRPLVNSTMPTKLRVEALNESESKVQYLKSDQEGLYEIDLVGEKRLFQGVNCLNVGHPNAIINLDFTLSSRRESLIRASVEDTTLSIGYYLFDKHGRKNYFISESDKASLEIQVDKTNLGYSLIIYDKNLGCDADKVINMKDFTAHIALR